MDVPDRTVEILKRLLAASQMGKVEWVEGGDAEEFMTSLKSGSIVIGMRARGDGYYVRLQDASGVTIETSWLDGSKSLYDSYSVLRDVHEAARRKALRIEQTLNALEKELDDLQ